MYAWEAIQDALNYVEEHLQEDMKLETLANTAALSPYYFQRLFARLVGKTVKEYIKLRKLAKASEALLNKENRIIDVALDFGFSDHANFTRSFKDAYGITPDEYRTRPVKLNHFLKPVLLIENAAADEGVPLIADGIVVEITRRKLDIPRWFMGIEAEMPDMELTGGKITGISLMGLLWDRFHRLKPNMNDLLPQGNEIGVIYMGSAQEGFYTYMAGAECENEQTADYSTYKLPRGDYVVCGVEAENFSELVGSAIFKASTFLSSWVSRNSLVCGVFIAEMYYNTTPDASYMELWLPLKSSPKLPDAAATAWDKTNEGHKPSMATISAYVNNPLFESLCGYVETEYQSKPVFDYSRCSMQFGWNVKFKKAGRTLCTLYPMEGYFIALIVIGDREKADAERMLPFFTEYLQQVYRETKTGMGQKWLMINVTNDAVLEDVKQCIALRRGIKVS